MLYSMKLKEFNYYFLNPKLSTKYDIAKKKPNPFFKQYLTQTRLNNYVCADYSQYLSLLQRVIYFLQTSVAADCSFVFFFDSTNLMALYKEVTRKCNEYWAFTPVAYSWLTSWNPQRVFCTAGGMRMPLSVENSIAIIPSPVLINVAFLLLHQSWPVLLSVPITSAQVHNGSKTSLLASTYILPSSLHLNLPEQYFRLAFFAQIIRKEKLRR